MHSPYAINPVPFGPECDVITVKANRRDFDNKLNLVHWFSLSNRRKAVGRQGAQRHDDIITDNVGLTRSQRAVSASLADNSVGQEQNRIRPVLLPPFAEGLTMVDWRPKESELKRYPHFDQYLPPAEIERIVKDPERVAKNAFFPFICYEKKWQPFRAEAKRPDKKKRLIRYAARRDAYIFSYYRHILSEKYEDELVKLGVAHCPIAYRRIPADGGKGGGKCNINFAKDAIERIESLGDCCVVVLDISKYFESIDHGKLRALWCKLLDVENLPADHSAVFRAITRYSFVNRDAVYERLGYFGEKNKGGRKIRGYLMAYKEMAKQKQLCPPKEFREKICGEGEGYDSLIQVNKENYGIPQGAPMSDLLANLYLINFDKELSDYAAAKGGAYFRYSDDIFLVIPGGSNEGIAARDFVVSRISSYGDQLVIKKRKTSLIRYYKTADGQGFEFIDGAQGQNGVEYLGFRYDGKKAFLRDSTLSRFHRSIAYAARYEAVAFVRRYPGKDLAFLIAHFNISRFIAKFGRVENFEEKSEYRDWSFWTYAKRSSEVFGELGAPILRQISGHKEQIKARMAREIKSALARETKRRKGPAE